MRCRQKAIIRPPSHDIAEIDQKRSRDDRRGEPFAGRQPDGEPGDIGARQRGNKAVVGMRRLAKGVVFGGLLRRVVQKADDRMLPAFAVALGLPGDFFAPFFADEAHAVVRFLHYPPQETAEDNTFGQAPHTDNSFMTALARTDVPGLAVRLPSSEWFAPPIIPGTFLINLGNIMRRWSNDRFLSTPHGVLNESGTDRYSIAYFYSPNPKAVIECAPTCVTTENPPRYAPAVYRDLVLEFYRANYFHQRGHRSTAAAQAAA